jgi:hypothetical protein
MPAARSICAAARTVEALRMPTSSSTSSKASAAASAARIAPA